MIMSSASNGKIAHFVPTVLYSCRWTSFDPFYPLTMGQQMALYIKNVFGKLLGSAVYHVYTMYSVSGYGMFGMVDITLMLFYINMYWVCTNEFPCVEPFLNCINCRL